MTSYTTSAAQTRAIRERVKAVLTRNGINPENVLDQWSLEWNSSEGATLRLEVWLPLTLEEASEIVNGPANPE